ncbi:choice-of-anchor A family protein [Streptomyces sp. NRRL F-5727]|uniref:choice-of-anchor A family protein n=1 Tax=Streptomyces sp. NRRL F-5727 TaxID=1463871 RepID=UPI0004CA044A|nr:choice-of-anchor A family protein [Streptomyces sp. NRRL F-5727]
MRTSAAVATVLAVTGAALAWAPTASAAGPECAVNPLGTAGRYAEFVEKDSVRHSDSEGAVAVGGDAAFGTSNQSGFSVGSRLTDADLAGLPGGHSLVVGGTLKADGVVLVKGSGVAGEIVDASEGDGGFGVDGPITEGPSPVDFGKEFAHLRTLSAGWAGEKPNGEAAGGQDGRSLYLTGTDARLNVFALSTADLEKAGEIYLKVPAGSSTLVNVIGASYDMAAKPTSGVWISEGGAYVQDDYDRHTDGHKSIRSKLLWNFPQAETVRKNSSAWPGAILAPRAAVTMTSGHINGSLIAESLDTAPGAETHQMNFTGCLPRVTTPGPVVTPEPPKPTDTPAPSAPPSTTAPAPEGTGSPSATPEPSGTAPADTPSDTPSGTPAESTAPPAAPEETGTTPAPSATTPEGDLATTGSAIGPGVIGAAVGALLLGGGFLAFAKRRRRA